MKMSKNGNSQFKDLKIYVIFPEQKDFHQRQKFKKFRIENLIFNFNNLIIPERLAVNKHMIKVTNTSKYLLFAPNPPQSMFF